MFGLFFVGVPHESPQGSTETMHHGYSLCCFRLLLGFSLLSQNTIPCTKGKSRKTKTETTCSTPQGPHDDFSKYFDLGERAI